MSLNIDQFTESELVDLNHRIVEPQRFLRQMRAHASMLKFSIGAQVCFETDDLRTTTGTLIRYNKKTVSPVTNDGHRWNVSPSLLRLVEPRDITPVADVQGRNILQK
ncbi:hypothetical protein RP726_09505 [Candidatus Methylospira mobilis]|uniref:hypothetical protein n=1 Tax=Candidatus Methylospira mobilis TaxID=1808979 RepID=UPI0028E2D9B5|nr:hypothetical protein [Candidatus Methylospira mobilis]WNV06623.1 hypothetical protein RP726_09505 [Candidatus Methylospira mobilis]